MSNYLIEKIENLIDTGIIFATTVDTPTINFCNYQSAKVCIKTDVGTETKTTARIIAILPNDTELEIKSKEIIIGNKIETTIDIVADELAHYNSTKFKIKIDAVDKCEIQGAITAILGEPRYSE